MDSRQHGPSLRLGLSVCSPRARSTRRAARIQSIWVKKVLEDARGKLKEEEEFSSADELNFNWFPTIMSHVESCRAAGHDPLNPNSQTGMTG